MSSEQFDAFRFHVGPDRTVQEVTSAIAEWQLDTGSHTRIFVREEHAVICGVVEHWVVIDGFVARGRSEIGILDYVLGVNLFMAAMCKKFEMNPETTRLMTYGGTLHASPEKA